MTREERDAKILQMIPQYGNRGTARAMGVSVGCINHVLRRSAQPLPPRKAANKKLEVPLLEKAPTFRNTPKKPLAAKPAKVAKPEIKFGPSQCNGVAGLVISQAVRESGRGGSRSMVRQFRTSP